MLACEVWLFVGAYGRGDLSEGSQTVDRESSWAAVVWVVSMWLLGIALCGVVVFVSVVVRRVSCGYRCIDSWDKGCASRRDR